MLVPASTGSGESDLVSARLVEVLTVVSAVERWSEVSGANSPEVVLAVLEMLVVREESTLTTRVTDLLAPLVIVVRFHPTTPAVRVPPPVAEIGSAQVGMAVTGVTRVPSDAPLYENVTV